MLPLSLKDLISFGMEAESFELILSPSLLSVCLGQWNQPELHASPAAQQPNQVRGFFCWKPISFLQIQISKSLFSGPK